MTQKEKLEIAEEKYFEKFNTWIPRLMGIDEEHYQEDKFIEKIYEAIRKNDRELVYEDYPLSDVDY